MFSKKWKTIVKGNGTLEKRLGPLDRAANVALVEKAVTPLCLQFTIVYHV